MNGFQRIAQERLRQIEEEGYDEGHDDAHSDDELARAAAVLAAPERIFVADTSFEKKTGEVEWVRFFSPWPWDEDSPEKGVEYEAADQIETRIRELEKAGALVAAEIDRLLRKLARVRKEDSDG